MSASRPMTLQEWALLLFLSVLWGGSYLFVGVATHSLPPPTLAAIRVVLGAAGLIVLLRLAGGALPRGRGVWPALFVMAVLNNVVPFMLIAWSQARIPSGLAAILSATTPMFTVLVAHFATDERITPVRGLGILVGFAGVVAMIGLEAVSALDGDLLAEAAMLLASVFYALSAVYGRRFSRMGVPPLAAATGQIAAAAIMLVPLSLVVDRPWLLPPPGLAVAGAMLGLGLLSTSLAYLIFFRILATAGATNLMLVTLLIPVSAILFGATLLGEHLHLSHFAGMALIAAGLALIDGRVLRLFRPASA